MGVLQSSINKILQVQIQNPGLRFSPCYFVARMLERCYVALFVLDFSLNFDDHREYFVGVTVDIPVVAHVDECIPVVAVKTEDCIAVVGAMGDCIVVAYSLVDKAHHSKHGIQAVGAADNIVAEAVDNIVEVADN